MTVPRPTIKRQKVSGDLIPGKTNPSCLAGACQRMCIQLLSHVQLFATPWTVAHQAPLSMRLFQARILERVAISFSRGSSLLGDRTCVFFVLHWNLVLAFLSASPA